MRRRIRRKKDENVLVHKLVGHHQGGDRNSKLAPGQAARQAISFLEPVNVVEGEDYDRLRDLGSLELADAVERAMSSLARPMAAWSLTAVCLS